MEVIRRFYYGRVIPAWLAFASAVGGFLDEAAFRVSLVWSVLLGRVPIEKERRWWNRNREVPVLVDVYSWVDDRLIFSVLIWPSLESSPHDADRVFDERVREVKEAIAKGCADKAWSTLFETDYGLQWDHRREVWVDEDGQTYDGARFKAGHHAP